MKRIAVLALAGLAAAAATAVALSGEGERILVEPQAASPRTAPGGVHALLYARPFRLAEPYPNRWRADGRAIDAGWLVVLQVDRALVEPRSELEPLLYAGDATVERINHGHASGHVIGVVPGTDPLDATPFWFGDPELPERVTAASLAVERAAAERAGVRPLDASSALEGDVLALADHGALRRAAARLILEWSPAEHELAEGILAPLVR